MRQYPKPLARLINEMSKLPGIGSKTAQRLAFYILSLEDKEAEQLAQSILTAKREMRYCSVCGNLTDTDPCSICSDPSRDGTEICVVESPKDVMAMERIREFNGLYHVLHGVISPMDGIGPEDIVLHSHEDCLANKKHFAENFRHIEEESNKLHPQRMVQALGNKYVVVNPPFPPMNTKQIDHSFDLPYTRLPHPKYKGKRIPAYEMEDVPSAPSLPIRASLS